MDEFLKQLFIRIGWSVFPVSLFFIITGSNPAFVSPTPTPTMTPSPTLSITPTDTVTPTLTPTPKPTNTPTPSLLPTPSPIPVTSQQLDEWFTIYSNHFAIDRQKLWKVAVCESNLRFNARNGDYGGLFQFSTYTWKTTRRAMNMDPNPELRFHPEEAIRTAAFKISTAGLAPWPNCGK
ncbi:TPA: hypothetical protein DIS60_00245 [Patescibacteria group bacterium]|nr:hypothetical protein [Patescibacteria group bacterium]